MPWIDLIPKAFEIVHNDLVCHRITALNESDIQWSICAALRSVLLNCGVALTVNSESPWYNDETGEGPLYIDVTVFERDQLNLSYEPVLRRKGYRYDGASAAIELKYCRYPSEILGLSEDIQKLRALAKRRQNSCFAVAFARTEELQSLLFDSLAGVTQDLAAPVELFIASVTDATAIHTRI